jgi:signal transduction histidine kinase/ActR/RegA family two-component response regulator
MRFRYAASRSAVCCLWLTVWLLALTAPASTSAASNAEWRATLQAAEHDPAKTLQDAEQALHQARERGDKAAEMRALLALLPIYDAANILFARADDIARGSALARELGDAGALCLMLDLDGYVAGASNAPEAVAAAKFDEAFALADRRKLDECRAWTYLYQGQVLMYASHTAAAMTAQSKAYELFQAQDDRYAMARSLRAMAVIYGSMGGDENTKKALDYAKQDSTLFDSADYRLLAADRYNVLGWLYTALRDWPRADAYYEQARDIYRSSRLPLAAALVAYRLAINLSAEKRYADAVAMMDKPVIDALKQLSGSDYHWSILLSRANALAALGRKEESLAALEEGQAAFKAGSNVLNLPGFHRIVADIHAKLGMYAEAYRDMLASQKAENRRTSEQNAKLTAEITARFDNQLKDAENARLRAQAQETEANRRALALALALTVLLSTGLVLWLRRRAGVARLEAAHHAALARAEASANAAKGEFLSNMSHELRSPLNAILGFTRIAAREPDVPAHVRADLGIVVRSGEHLYSLINQVLDLSKIEAGRMVLHETACDLAVLIDEIDELFGLASSQKGLALIIDSGPTVLPPLRLDADKLRQVLINLIGNAIKFTHTGSVTLRLRVSGGNDAPLRLSVAVSDTGPGIAPEELAQLGQAFVQAEAGRSSREGTGLGLALCRAFVQLMGGELKLTSEPGHGMTAAFDLPVKIIPGEAITLDKSVRQVLRLEPDQPRYRILVVDDREEGRHLLERLLTPLGFEVREAGDGQQAVEAWRTWQPHLIFMDMRMPIMDGREATRRIKAEAQEPVAIVALTASSFESERLDILAAGCDDFLRKPFREPDLFAVLKHHLGARFVYEDSAPGNAMPVDPAALAALPAPLRQALIAALERLDMTGVDEALDAIGAHDPAAAAALAPLAAEFQYAQMRSLIEP